MRERDPLLDTSLPELFDAERPKHASAEATWAAIAGRAIGAYAVAQAERDHLRRALEWLNECNIGCVHPAGECYDLPHPGDSAPDCRPCRMALATAAAHGRDLRAFWHEWTRNGENTEAALAATEAGGEDE